jgi:rSAM/selenodomain-associated transferase 1
MSKQQLIVFVKNLIPGTVKTRLADEIGTDLALEVYKNLVMNTSEITDKLKMDRAIYYSEYVELYDFFDDEVYSKHIQEGDDLGQRMLNAFFDGIEDGYEKVVLIGSDIPDISKKIIEDAFAKLDDHDVVVGPAEDGGYYLIGMKNAHKQLFEGMEYSQPNVFQDLVDEIESSGMKYATTQTLFDLDTKADMKKAGIQIVYEEEDEDSGDDYDL